MKASIRYSYLVSYFSVWIAFFWYSTNHVIKFLYLIGLGNLNTNSSIVIEFVKIWEEILIDMRDQTQSTRIITSTARNMNENLSIPYITMPERIHIS